MILPNAVQSLVIKAIKLVYEELKDPVEVLDTSQEISATRQTDGTTAYTVPKKMVQPEIDGGMLAVVAKAASTVAEYMRLANQVHTDLVSGVGKFF